MKAKLFYLIAAIVLTFSQTVFAQGFPTTAAEKRAALLTPEYYTDFLGASFFTIATIEKEFEVNPVRILDLTFFYDFGDCFVGMQANTEGVVIQMSMRLYSEMAFDFVMNALDYGYSYYAKGENVGARINSGKLLPDVYDSEVVVYRRLTAHGSVYMQVSMSAQYAGEYEVTVYRGK